MPNCEPAAVVTNAGTCFSSKESKRSFFTICACTLPGSNMQTSAAAPIFHLLNCIMSVLFKVIDICYLEICKTYVVLPQP